MGISMNVSAQLGDQDDAPLDPAIERVRARMMRLMIISVAIMMVGLIAVIAAIVYKVTGRSVPMPVSASAVERRMALPDGARIVSATPNGGDILFVVEPAGGGRQQFWIYRYGEDRVVAKVSID
jgi:hypothetical protein